MAPTPVECPTNNLITMHRMIHQATSFDTTRMTDIVDTAATRMRFVIVSWCIVSGACPVQTHYAAFHTKTQCAPSPSHRRHAHRRVRIPRRRRPSNDPRVRRRRHAGRQHGDERQCVDDTTTVDSCELDMIECIDDDVVSVARRAHCVTAGQWPLHVQAVRRAWRADRADS